MSKDRRKELDNNVVRADLKRHIADLKILETIGQLNLLNNLACDSQDNSYELLPFETKPLREQVKNEEKCFLTCYVRKTDKEYESFLEHKAISHTTKISAKTRLRKAQYLVPLVKGAIDGYYEIESYEIKDGKVQFSLGKYNPLSEMWVHIYDRMRPGELLNLDDCQVLCKKD